MEEIIIYLRGFNLITVLLRLVLAVILGGLIGIERGRNGHAAGLRTHILVSIGAAMTTLIGLYVSLILDFDSDPLRLGAQVVSGIGFLGVGTILLKGRFQISGLTTAAGLWATASVGLAAGAGFYEGAFAGTLLIILAIMLLPKFETIINLKNKRFGIYLELTDETLIKEKIEMLAEKYGAGDIQVTAPRSAVSGNVGIEATIRVTNKKEVAKRILKELAENEKVLYALESI